MVKNNKLHLSDFSLIMGSVGRLSCVFEPGLHLIAGPNGVGKTTLLNTLAGSLPSRSGTAHLNDAALRQSTDQVILAPGTPPPIPWIRAGMLLDFILSLYPRTVRDETYRADVLRRLAIDDSLDVVFGALSAGTAKKFLLAATLIAAPPLMLFDEPLNEIDAASATQLMEMLADYRKEHIMLVTTHQLTKLTPLATSTLNFKKNHSTN